MMRHYTSGKSKMSKKVYFQTNEISELRTKIEWLEQERFRLIELQRQTANSLMSSPARLGMYEPSSTPSKTDLNSKTIEKERLGPDWDLASKSYTIRLKQPTNHKGAHNTWIKFSCLKRSYSKEARLTVLDFLTDPFTNKGGQLESCGHIKIGDCLQSVNSVQVSSYDELDREMKRNAEALLLFSRPIATERITGNVYSIEEAVDRLGELEKELKNVKREKARLDIGALEALEDALERKKHENQNLKNKELERQNLIADLRAEVDEHAARYRHIYNVFADYKGAMRVFVRIRPPDKETRNQLKVIEVKDACRLKILRSVEDNLINRKVHRKEYTFDHIFDTASKTEDIYAELDPLVESACNGSSASIISFGQKSSGKTFSMEGSSGEKGIYSRALSSLIDYTKNRRDGTYSLRMSVFEVYEDSIIDLLEKIEVGNQDGEKVNSTNNPGADSASTNGLAVHVVKSHDTAIGCLKAAARKRRKQNGSSCSHMIVQFTIKARLATDTKFDEEQNGLLDNSFVQSFASKLQLVDLAGSDKLSYQATNTKETLSINKSLSALGNVLSCLSMENEHVPFSESVLTSVMKDTLLGNAKTLMMVHLSSHEQDLPETLRSLEFAQRVSRIKMTGHLVSPLFATVCSVLTEEKKTWRRHGNFLSNSVDEAQILRKKLQDAKEEARLARQELTNLNENMQEQELENFRKQLKLRNERDLLTTELEESIRVNKQLKRRAENELRIKEENDLRKANKAATQAQQELETLKKRNLQMKRKLQEAEQQVITLRKQASLKSTTVREKNAQLKREIELLRKNNKELLAKNKKTLKKSKTPVGTKENCRTQPTVESVQRNSTMIVQGSNTR